MNPREIDKTIPITRVLRAFSQTPVDYLDAVIAQRAGKSSKAQGSTYPEHDTDSLRKALFDRDWEPYTHPAVEGPAQAYISPGFGGRLGVVRLDSLDPRAQIVLVDPKGTGFVEGVVVPGAATVLGQPVEFSVLILGPSEGKEVVYTFHPGDPVHPSKIPVGDVVKSFGESSAVDQKRQGTNAAIAYVTAAEALKLGLVWVKLPA